MKQEQKKILEELIERYPILESCSESIQNAFIMMADSFRMGNKMLVAGNGGSAADSEHIVGELMKGFVKARTLSSEFREELERIDYVLGKELGEKLQGALPVISLVGHPGLSTAYHNDKDPVLGFAQQVNGYGRKGDILWVITTSGNSKNIIYSSIVAKAKSMKVVALTGRDGGRIKDIADVSIIVPVMETYKIQEYHLPIYHALCMMLENEFFDI